jgi:hypothetical protein
MGLYEEKTPRWIGRIVNRNSNPLKIRPSGVVGYVLGFALLLLVLPAFLQGMQAFFQAFAQGIASSARSLGTTVLWLLIGAVVVWIGFRGLRYKQQQQQTLQTALYQLMQENHGRVSVLDLATKAQLPLSMAKPFLEQTAREFDTEFEVTEQGDIWYCFQTARSSLESSPNTIPVKRELPQKPVKSNLPQKQSESNLQGSNSIAAQSPLSQSQNSSKAETYNPRSVRSEPSKDLSESNSFKPLIQAELARRLQVSPSTVSNRKVKPDFSDWSKSKDPEGIAWNYSKETQKFYRS